MSGILEQEFDNIRKYISKGRQIEAVKQEDGTFVAQKVRMGATGLDLTPPIQTPLKTGEAQTYEQTKKEFIPALAGAGAGPAVGIGEVIDLGLGVLKGAYNAVNPDADQGRFEAFMTTLGEQFESGAGEAVRSKVLDLGQRAGLDEEQMEVLDEGMTAGSFFGYGGVAKAAPKVAAKLGDAIEGAGDAAKARMADADGSVTLGMNIDPDPAIAAAGDAVKAMRGTQPVADKTISQRLPTAVASTEDPIATKLVTDTATTLQQPDKKLQSNFEKISAYPNMPDNLKDMNFQDAAVTVKQHIVDNLLFLHDRVPENTRQRSKLWYDGANKISNDYATQYNVPLESVSGVMAALSPQKDWYMNADLGRRVIDIHNRVTKGNEVNMAMTPEMTTKMGELFSKGGVTKPKDAVIIEAISGKKFSDLELPAEKAMWLRVYDETYNERSYPIVNPEGTFGDLVKTTKGENAKAGWGSLSEIGKAITSLESGGDLKVISDAMGGQNKVRNFYNNIYNPNSANGDVTIDTHAVAAGWLRPLAGDSTEVHHNFGSAPDAKKRDERWSGGMSNTSITGIKGIYGIFADAYREAAAQRGILPREMQSITWEAVRGLFPATDKGNKAFVEDITKIWYDYKQGTKTLEEAQNAVEQRAGYINEPTWKQ